MTYTSLSEQKGSYFTPITDDVICFLNRVSPTSNLPSTTINNRLSETRSPSSPVPTGRDYRT